MGIGTPLLVKGVPPSAGAGAAAIAAAAASSSAASSSTAEEHGGAEWYKGKCFAVRTPFAAAAARQEEPVELATQYHVRWIVGSETRDVVLPLEQMRQHHEAWVGSHVLQARRADHKRRKKKRLQGLREDAHSAKVHKAARKEKGQRAVESTKRALKPKAKRDKGSGSG